MNNKDLRRVIHMKEYCDKINNAILRFGGFDVFDSDVDYYQSITMSLFQIGELSNGLSNEFKDNSKNKIPWNSIRRVRNMFAHEYQRINKETIWKSLQDDIPILLQFCNQIIADENAKGE